MSFLQPWLLALLPLLLVPLIIHLINQWRYQTKRWGAMMFLLTANRMARGYAKLRQWLILAARMAAIAGLVFAISRPLASGLMGMAASGRPDTSIVLLDRSPSMEAKSLGGAESKLETGRRQLRQALSTIGSKRWVLVDSATDQPREFEKLEGLLESPQTEPFGASSDIPGMLQKAAAYLAANRPGPTEIWICSDLRTSDWQPDSPIWSVVREQLLQFPKNVRFHLIAYPDAATDNRSIRVTSARRERTAQGIDLVLSWVVRRDGVEGKNDLPAIQIPVEIEMEGNRSQVEMEVAGPQAQWNEHRIRLNADTQRGWGKVSIPADANPADNTFYFVFDAPPPRRALLICQDDATAGPLALAAGIPPQTEQQSDAQRLPWGDTQSIDWQEVGLLIWQGTMPQGDRAAEIERFVSSGGSLLLFPPTAETWGSGSTANPFLGVQWDAWKPLQPVALIDQWRGDSDLLAATRSGAALPVGQIELSGIGTWKGDAVALASLADRTPVLARIPTDRGSVYLCGASPLESESNLARQGIVLYAMIQRAIEQGTLSLGRTRGIDAGSLAASSPSNIDLEGWQALGTSGSSLSSEIGFQPGVFQSEKNLIAINRSNLEDQPDSVSPEQIDKLFEGLPLTKVEQKTGSASSLVREVWRLFVMLMIAALIAEAILCMPRRPVAKEALR